MFFRFAKVVNLVLQNLIFLCKTSIEKALSVSRFTYPRTTLYPTESDFISERFHPIYWISSVTDGFHCKSPPSPHFAFCILHFALAQPCALCPFRTSNQLSTFHFQFFIGAICPLASAPSRCTLLFRRRHRHKRKHRRRRIRRFFHRVRAPCDLSAQHPSPPLSYSADCRSHRRVSGDRSPS